MVAGDSYAEEREETRGEGEKKEEDVAWRERFEDVRRAADGRQVEGEHVRRQQLLLNDGVEERRGACHGAQAALSALGMASRVVYLGG